MSRYSKPELKPPVTVVGTWDQEPCVLSMQTRLKIVVRVPEKLQTLDDNFDAAAEDFDKQIRRMLARQMVGMAYAGFEIVGAVIEQFEEAGG